MNKSRLQVRLRFVILIAFILMGVPFAFAPQSLAQDQNINLRSALSGNYDGVTPFFVHFVTPVGGDSVWEIPFDFMNKDGNKIGQRILQEIGEDYLYIEEQGQGATFKFWIPFSNIAYISSP